MIPKLQEKHEHSELINPDLTDARQTLPVVQQAASGEHTEISSICKALAALPPLWTSPVDRGRNRCRHVALCTAVLVLGIVPVDVDSW
jgi:hypothetical protein